MKRPKLIVSISSGFIWRLLFVSLAIWFLYTIREVLGLFFMSLVIVSAASPIVDRLQRRKVPRPISAIFIFSLLFIALIYLIYLIIPIIIAEFRLLVENLPGYFEQINSTFRNINRVTGPYQLELNLQKFNENISDNIASSTANIYSNTVAFFGGVFNIFVLFSLSFYMLVKQDAIKNFLYTIVPGNHQDYAVDLAHRIQYKMGRWLIGQLLLMFIVFALDYVALTALGVPYALILALLGGMLEIIPYMGPLIALVPAALVGLTVSPYVGLAVIILYVFIQQLENYLITPMIMRKAVGLNPVAVILALLVGAELAGIIGVIISVPAATAISVFVSDLVNRQEEDKILEPMQS